MEASDARYRIYLLDDYGEIFLGCDAEWASDAEVLARAASMLAEVEPIFDQAEVWLDAKCVGWVCAPTRQNGSSLDRQLV